MKRRRRLPIAALLLAIAFWIASASVAVPALPSPPRPKLLILTRSVRVDHRFHVSVPVRCIGAAGEICLGSVWLNREIKLRHGKPFPLAINVPRRYRLAAGRERSVRVEIPNWLRRPRGERAGKAWVEAEFETILGAPGRRAILLHWPRLLKPRHRG